MAQKGERGIRQKQRALRKKPQSPARPQAPDPASANHLRAYQNVFLEWTLVTGLSEQTAKIRKQALDGFILWCDERSLQQPQDITRPILQRYQSHLYHYRKSNGQPLSFNTQATRLHPLVAFFKWLARDNHILHNPASDLVLPKPPRQLPKHLMSVAEIDSILNQADIETPSGIRNRAILETLYSSGIRRAELIHLSLYDIDTERGTLMVRQGKGRKDRLIPIGARACAWVTRYVQEVRPQFVPAQEQQHLFITDYGEAFEKNRLSDMVKLHMKYAGLNSGGCHAFRHACATHMLENGADIRYIQAILGHAELSTTQIYTHVAIGKLKAVHALTHPARLQRLGGDQSGEVAGSEVHDEKTLLSALEAEANEETSAETKGEA
ncbi:site-specific tyrosine recombinase XerC [Undibacterium sp. Xuan67W]|uniref:site-specific tyrosine recombinase XerC n=1 Tax=Undibacterium sp. Xuan67W TaxID=3413057 RepID=UPI003BF087D4